MLYATKNKWTHTFRFKVKVKAKPYCRIKEMLTFTSSSSILEVRVYWHKTMASSTLEVSPEVRSSSSSSWRYLSNLAMAPDHFGGGMAAQGRVSSLRLSGVCLRGI